MPFLMELNISLIIIMRKVLLVVGNFLIWKWPLQIQVFIYAFRRLFYPKPSRLQSCQPPYSKIPGVHLAGVSNFTVVLYCVTPLSFGNHQ